MKTLTEKIEVMQAALDGKTVEMQYKGTTEWTNGTSYIFNWVDFDYRVKPEEKWVNYYPRGANIKFGSIFSSEEFAKQNAIKNVPHHTIKLPE